jgi:CBS domain-containing protein
MKPICTADTLMTKRIITLSAETNVLEGLDYLLAHQISGAPVVDSQNRYLGVFSEKCCLSLLTLVGALACEESVPAPDGPNVRSFMARRLHTLDPSADVIAGIGVLLKHDISGAPVLDREEKYLGVFTEKTSMDVLLGALYDQLPTTSILAFLNRDVDRLIPSDTSLWSAAGLFVSARYRRLIVFEEGRVAGLVARRDLLRASRPLLRKIWSQLKSDHAELPVSHWDDSQISLHCESESVCHFMDVNAQVIGPETDLFTIAQIFRNTNYRRLPVIERGTLVGLVNRKDVLHAAYDIIGQPQRNVTDSGPLRLSAL